MLRQEGDQAVVVLYNFAAEPRSATVKSFPFSADSLVDLLTGESYNAITAGEPYMLDLPPAGSLWLTSE